MKHTTHLSPLIKANILCKSTLPKKKSQCNTTAYSIRILSLILYDFAKSDYVNRLSGQIYNILFLFYLVFISRGCPFRYFTLYFILENIDYLTEKPLVRNRNVSKSDAKQWVSITDLIVYKQFWNIFNVKCFKWLFTCNTRHHKPLQRK